jgi:hypothetical protein
MNPNNETDLSSFISFSECEGLNLEGDGQIKGVFGFGEPIKTNKDDPETLLNIKFKELVNISGILIEGGMNKEMNPSTMKVYSNQTALNISDVETLNPIEKFSMANLMGKIVPLKIAKFKNINTLHVRF